VVLLGGLSVVLMKTADEPKQAASTTTVDPSAPPPIGQIPLGGRATTTTSPEAAAGWQLYRAPDGTFSISFPGKANATGIQRRTIGGGDLTGLEAILEVGTDGPAYEAAYLDLPTASFFADSQDVFDKVLADDYVADGPIDVGPGFSAVHFASKPGVRLAEQGFVLLKGKRYYLVRARDVTDEDWQKYVTSFRWLKDPSY
jgi:hypothetical protein